MDRESWETRQVHDLNGALNKITGKYKRASVYLVVENHKESLSGGQMIANYPRLLIDIRSHENQEEFLNFFKKKMS